MLDASTEWPLPHELNTQSDNMTLAHSAPSTQDPHQNPTLQDSPYSRVCHDLISHGWPAIPCMPGSKVPGRWRGLRRGWQPLSDWQQYSDLNLLTDILMASWCRIPDDAFGVCSPVPAGVVWLDLDSFDGNLAADLIELLDQEDGTHIRRRGAKGFAQPFLVADGLDLPSALWLDSKKTIEFLGVGRQVVLPPTVHPDTNQPYVWLTADTCENTSIVDLPVMDAELFAAIEDMLCFFGSVDTVREKPVRARTPRDRSDDGEFQFAGLADQVDAAAFKAFDLWVPMLGLHEKRKRDGYLALATWRPSAKPLAQRVKEPNLGISSLGIRDFGTDEGYTPIGLVAAALGVDYVEAMWWLKDIVDPWPPLPASLQGDV